MSDLNAEAVIQLVNEVKKAILEAQQRPGAKNIKVTKVDLELKSTFTKEGEGGITDKITSWIPIPIELSGKISQASTDTISLSLVPEPALELYGEVSDELADAIEVIAKGADAAAQSSPTFGLTEATVSLNIGWTKEGKVVVLVGGEVQSDVAHTAKLTLQRR